MARDFCKVMKVSLVIYIVRLLIHFLCNYLQKLFLNFHSIINIGSIFLAELEVSTEPFEKRNNIQLRKYVYLLACYILIDTSRYTTEVLIIYVKFAKMLKLKYNEWKNEILYRHHPQTVVNVIILNLMVLFK